MGGETTIDTRRVYSKRSLLLSGRASSRSWSISQSSGCTFTPTGWIWWVAPTPAGAASHLRHWLGAHPSPHVLHALAPNHRPQEELEQLLKDSSTSRKGRLSCSKTQCPFVQHPTTSADYLETILPKSFVSIYRYWSFSLFYILAELWGTVQPQSRNSENARPHEVDADADTVVVCRLVSLSSLLSRWLPLP